MIAGRPSEARADADAHAQEDAFAAEAAALLPAAVPPIAEATAPLDRITLGEWGAVIPWTPHIPVSAATLPDGRVLTFASNQRTTFPSGAEFTYAATWDPATGVFVEYNHPSHDMFCGGIATLPDGRVLVNGGRNTTVRSSIFDWRVNTWTRTPDMNDPRWYNTTVALPNGRAWTVTGDGGSGTSERWDSASGWSRLTGINWNPILAEPGYITRWHPFVLVSPDGRLIHFGPTDTMHWVSPDGTGSVSNTGTVVPGGHYPKEGSWVMYNEGRILVVGGGTSTANNASDTTTGNSTNAAYTVDVRTGTPVVTPVASMTFKRQFANGVVLPNGEVMIMGGNTSGLKFNDTGSILTPEIWNPITGLWRSMANAVTPRNYHSLALLLPDGRVLSGGGGLGGGDHRDAELFTPPNLFNADGSLAARPTLSTAPATIGVATTFTVTGTPGIQKFSFIKMSAITHSVNTDLRYLSLPFVETSPGNYALTAHTNLNVMTPGYWMLFGLDAAGVHSVAKIILVDAISSVSIAVPGNQSSYIGQSSSLQMIASSPAGSVLNWSATGLPAGLTISSTTGLISGTPTTLGTFPVQVTLSNATTSATANFSWTIQPATFSQNYSTFSSASGWTLNGNAAITDGVLRLTTNIANQVGSAFLTSPIAIGPDTSIAARWVFRIHGSADGADGLTFVIQGNGPTAIGLGGGGLGYDGISRSVAVEVDNYKGATDPDANHIGILSNGNVTVHLATNSPAWDLENGLSQTIWVEYDGPANQLRVYAAPDNVSTRPANPVMTASIDLAALVVGGQAWFGFTGGTGGAFNNQDIESWSLSVNAFALPAQPVFATPANITNVIGTALTKQMQATDPNGDLLTWSATGLPTGLSINPASGLISGTPTVVGGFSPTVTVTDNNTLPVNRNFSWTINNLLTVQPLSGSAVVAGTSVPLTAQASGGLNPQYRWNFGDGSPDTAFASSPSTAHLFPTPGRFLITVTVRDDTAREVTASYRQAVYAPPTATRPNSSTSIIYESRAGANARLWAVNPDNDSVTVFDAITRAKLAEVNVGRAPRSLALAPDGRVWVANAESDTLTILQTNYTIAQTVSLARGSRPFGLVFDPAGQNAFVALEAAGKILKLNPTNGATIATLDVGPNVRHLSITANGAQLLATRFITPRLPGEDTASPQTTVLGVKYGGEVLRINPTTLALVGTMILEHSEESDTSNSARGIPNYLGAAVISPDGQSAWVPSKQDNIKRGMLRNSGPLTHDMSIRSIASRINLATQTEDIAGRIDFDNAGIASAGAFDSQGVFLFTALEGSREIAVADAVAKQEILRFPAGRAPQGLVLSPDGRTLFVQNFMDRTISVHDLNTLANGSVTPPPAPVILNCVTTEKLAANVLVGKQVFYDAQDNRIALQQYISCASCHNDGGQDGRIWDFTQFGEGLRNTTTLRGHGGTAQGPLHWTGNFDEVQDFEGQIRAFAGGSGLMSDTDFHTGTRDQPMGDPKAGLSADLDALAAYLNSLTKNGDSPDRNADGTFTSAALAGQTVFQQQNCVQCHSGAQFTDSAINVFHDVGTLKPSSGQRLGATLTGLDTPTLRGLWGTAPYLHNGSAATLEAAVSAHNGVTLTAGELTNLVAFLRQLDDGGTSNPTISGIADQLTTVNTLTPAIPFTIHDADSPLVTLTLSLDSSNSLLVPTNNIIVGGSGTNRTLTVTPAAHQIGSATITVTLTDGLLATNVSFLLTVDQGQLTVTGITAANKIYDGTTNATLNSAAALVGVTGGDVVTLNTGSATGVFPNPSVGNGRLVTIAGLTLGGIHAGNYTLTQPKTTANITPKPVTPVIVANNKVYDGGTTATLSHQSVTGTVGAEVVLLVVGAANFDTRNAGASKLVTAASLGLGGPGASNYELSAASATNTAAITTLGITGDFTAASKPYDGNNPALVATRSLNGVLPADSANVRLSGGTATFADANVGAAKIITLTGAALLGSASDNYNLTSVNTATADIAPASLVVSADNQTRGYGLSNPVFTASYSGFVGGETLATSGVTGNPDLSTTATNTSPAGSYPLTATMGSLSAANYSFSFVAGTLIIAPAGKVTMSSIARLENSHMRITGAGDAGVKYIIQASSDLVNWEEIGTATAGVGGAFEFDDPNAIHLNHCFYRVALP